jgi:hypothetical protein
MAEKLYKITESGNLDAVAGCESLNEEQMQAWISENQVWFEEPNENQDLVKYIIMPLGDDEPNEENA